MRNDARNLVWSFPSALRAGERLPSSGVELSDKAGAAESRRQEEARLDETEVDPNVYPPREAMDS